MNTKIRNYLAANQNQILVALLMLAVGVIVHHFAPHSFMPGLVGMSLLPVSQSMSGRAIQEYQDNNKNAQGVSLPGISLRRPGYWQGGGYVSPQFVASLPLRALDGMPIDEYLNNIKGSVIDAVEYRFFDTRIIIAGTNLVAGTYNFFQKPIGSSEATLDGGTTIGNKTNEYTNAITIGTIEGANTLICDRMEISVYFPHRDFNAFTSNTGLPSTGAASATDTLSATNNLLALQQGSYFGFSQPNYPIFAEGKVLDFPSSRKIDGSFGGATPEGYVQNGGGDPRSLRYVRVMQALHNFTLQMQVYRTITFPLNTVIEVALCGIKLLG